MRILPDYAHVSGSLGTSITSQKVVESQMSLQVLVPPLLNFTERFRFPPTEYTEAESLINRQQKMATFSYESSEDFWTTGRQAGGIGSQIRRFIDYINESFNPILFVN